MNTFLTIVFVVTALLILRRFLPKDLNKASLLNNSVRFELLGGEISNSLNVEFIVIGLYTIEYEDEDDNFPHPIRLGIIMAEPGQIKSFKLNKDVTDITIKVRSGDKHDSKNIFI